MARSGCKLRGVQIFAAAAANANFRFVASVRHVARCFGQINQFSALLPLERQFSPAPPPTFALLVEARVAVD